MKKLSIPFLAILMLFCACAFADKKVEGNKDVNVRTVEVAEFSILKLSCACDIDLDQGEESKVVIEADENLQEYFEITSEGNKLTVKTKDRVGFRGFKKCKVTVYFKTLTELNSSCVGNVNSLTPLNFKNVEVDISSVGNTKLNITAVELDLNNKSVGNLTIAGSADSGDIRNSSVGNANLEDFVVKYLDVNNSSVGNMSVHATEELSIKNSGVGTMSYSGEPRIKELNNTSVGKLRKK